MAARDKGLLHGMLQSSLETQGADSGGERKVEMGGEHLMKESREETKEVLLFLPTFLRQISALQ